MTLIWTAFAAEQLECVYAFIKNKSEMAAVSIYNDILDEVDSLLHFPYMAPLESLLSEFTENYRSLVVRSMYKVVYYVNNETIYIVAFFDCRQSPEKLTRIFVKKTKT